VQKKSQKTTILRERTEKRQKCPVALDDRPRLCILHIIGGCRILSRCVPLGVTYYFKFTQHASRANSVASKLRHAMESYPVTYFDTEKTTFPVISFDST